MPIEQVVTLDPGESRVYNAGPLLENVLFDCTADDCALQIRMSGSNWTMRNVGVKGVFTRGSGINTYRSGTGDGFKNLIQGDEASNGETYTIESCYFGDGCAPGIDLSFNNSDADHAGHMEVRDSYFAGWNTSALYIAGSARVGSDGQGGTYAVRRCYFHDNNIASVRVARDGSVVEDCVFHNTGQIPWATFFGPLDDGIDAAQINSRAIWSSYGDPGQVVDVINCEIDHTYGDACPPDYGWPSDAEQTECYVSSVVGSGGDSSFDIQGGNCVPSPSGNITGDTSGNDPDITPPDQVPMSAEEAAGGEVIPTDTLTLSNSSGETEEYTLEFEGDFANTGTNANTNPDDPLRDSVTDNGDGTYTLHGYIANQTDSFRIHEEGEFTSITAPDTITFELNGSSITRSELLGGDAPPSTPQNIQRTPGVTSIDVSWDAPASGGDPSTYNVYVDGDVHDSVDAPTTSYTVEGLEASTTYSVGVSAVGALGGESNVVSDTVSTLEADFITQPLNVEATSTDAFTIDVAWDSPESLGPGLDFYTIYVDGVQRDTTSAETYAVENLDPETEYTIEVTATDTEGDESAPAELTASTTDEGIVTAPTGLHTVSIEADRIDVAWDEPEQTGEGGIAAYTVFLDGAEQGEVGPDNRTWTFTGLSPSTAYTIDVTATDAGGHTSSAASTSATTSGTETIAPDAPRNLEATSITGTSVTVAFDPPSSVGTSPLASYTVYIDGDQDHTLDANAEEFSVHGLSLETTYTFAIEAVSEAGLSSDTAEITITTTDGAVGGTPIDPDDPGCGFGNLQ